MENANDYDVLEIALDVAAERRVIYKPGKLIAAVMVNKLPVAAVGKVRLHFGSEGKGLRLRHESLPILRDPPRTDGLYLTIDQNLPGETLELWIGIDLTTTG